MHNDNHIDFNEIVNRYSDNIYHIALIRTNNPADAQDIVQETFLRYAVHIRNKGRFEENEHEKAWLIRVALNLCTDVKRSLWSRTDELKDENVPADEFCISDDCIYKAVMKLPTKYRDVIHLFYYEEYSISEIAAILKMNENTVKTNLSRGKKQLKKLLGDEYEYEI